jgi:hypothetical protein
MMRKITATHAIVIQAKPEEVWDYTQNWNRRPEWDVSVTRAKVLKEQPRTVWVHMRAGLELEVTYKHFERPRLTTLALKLIGFPWIKGGGGSWKYEAEGAGTRWTQHNTLELREDFVGRVTAPVFSRILQRLTIRMMERAKEIIETERGAKIELPFSMGAGRGRGK